VGITSQDLDMDGFLDTVFSNQLDESVSIYWGDGAAQFGTAQTLEVGRVSADVAAGDIDGDGRADLLVPDKDKSEIRTFLQHTPRTFTKGPSIIQPGMTDLFPIGLLRWDDDAFLDMFVKAEGSVKIRRGLGNTKFSPTQILLVDTRQLATTWRRTGDQDAVVVNNSNNLELWEAGKGGIPRRIAQWPLRSVTSLIPGEFGVRATVGPTVFDLSPDGSFCEWASFVDTVKTFVDLDADGVPEGLTWTSCSGCTSNHIVLRGKFEDNVTDKANLELSDDLRHGF